MRPTTALGLVGRLLSTPVLAEIATSVASTSSTNSAVFLSLACEDGETAAVDQPDVDELLPSPVVVVVVVSYSFSAHSTASHIF